MNKLGFLYKLTIFGIVSVGGIVISDIVVQAGTVYGYSELVVEDLVLTFTNIPILELGGTATTAKSRIDTIKNGTKLRLIKSNQDLFDSKASHITKTRVLQPSPCGENFFNPCGEEYKTVLVGVKDPALGFTENVNGTKAPTFVRTDVLLTAPNLGNINGINNSELYLQSGKNETILGAGISTWVVETEEIEIPTDGLFSIGVTGKLSYDLFASISGWKEKEKKITEANVVFNINVVKEPDTPEGMRQIVKLFSFTDSVSVMNQNSDDAKGDNNVDIVIPGNAFGPGDYFINISASTGSIAKTLNYDGADPYLSSILTHFNADTGELTFGGPNAIFISGIPTELPTIETVLDSNGNSVNDPLLGALLEYSGIFLEGQNSDGSFNFSDGLLKALDPLDPTNILFSADIVNILAEPDEDPNFSDFTAILKNFVPGSISSSSSPLLTELISVGVAATWLDPLIIDFTENFSQTGTTEIEFLSDTFPISVPESSSNLGFFAISILGLISIKKYTK